MKNNIYIKEKLYMFERNCPTCKKVLVYKNKNSYDRQNRKSGLCKSCAVKLDYKNNPSKNLGDNNGRSGKKLIDVMIDKYGFEQATIKYNDWIVNKNSFGTGQMNPQFGKSPFKNGGMSYKGWYRGIFFRSSFELMFLFEVLDRNPISAEGDRFRVSYGDGLHYHPDFFIEELNTVFEIKSYKWLHDSKNQLKIEAAAKYFSKLNIKYTVLTENELITFKKYGCDWQSIIYDFLYELVVSGDVKLTDISMSKLKNNLMKTKRNFKLNKLKNMDMK